MVGVPVGAVLFEKVLVLEAAAVWVVGIPIVAALQLVAVGTCILAHNHLSLTPDALEWQGIQTVALSETMQTAVGAQEAFSAGREAAALAIAATTLVGQHPASAETPASRVVPTQMMRAAIQASA